MNYPPGENGTITDNIRFFARWTNDPDFLTRIEGPFWSDEGTGEDAIYIYAFKWYGPPPQQSEFEKLMHKAVRQIDLWIAGRL